MSRVGHEGPRVNGAGRPVRGAGAYALQQAQRGGAHHRRHGHVVGRPRAHLVADVDAEVALGDLPAPGEVLRVGEEAGLGRSAAAVLTLDVSLQVPERVVAPEAQPRGWTVRDLEVDAVVRPA